MAFNAANLVYSTRWTWDGLFRMWEYDAGSDAIATVDAANYFVPAVKMLRRNEPLRVTASDGKAFYVVESCNPAVGVCDVVKLAAGVTSFPT